MPKRTDWLTDVARPVAEDLAARCGSLKKIMSAGVMALKNLTAEEREYYMAKADGIELKSPIPDKSPRQRLRNTISQIKEMNEIERQQPGTIYRVLDKDEQKVLDDFRKLVPPEDKKKRTKTA